MIENNIIKELDNYFVDNYNDIMNYKKNINNILISMNFNGFDTYNDFCSTVRKVTLIEINEKNNIIDVNNIEKLYLMVLNKVIILKIKENENFDIKILEYFNDDKLLDMIKNEK